MLQDRLASLDDEFARDVARGLQSRPRFLEPKYFYDEAGSELFEEITRQPEYYLTRAEASILKRYAPEIGSIVGGNVSLVELGSGSSAKTRILLESLLEEQTRLHYLPIDISPTILERSASDLNRRYPELDVTPIASQYEPGISQASVLVAEEDDSGPMLVLFLGSSIGNMKPGEAVDFLSGIGQRLDARDRFLVGFDLVKDRAVLNAAYNDAAGFTARFNQNLLVRVNRELGGEFDLDRFSHLAFFEEERSRIEMHLVSRARQSVPIRGLGESYLFEVEETIHTENSYKYTRPQVEDFGARSGLEIEEWFTDERDGFALALFARG